MIDIPHRLYKMFLAPQMFGGQEAFEMQVLLLLEIEFDPQLALRAYRRCCSIAKLGNVYFSGKGYNWEEFVCRVWGAYEICSDVLRRDAEQEF